MKNYRPWEPDRTYLLPPSTRDWLPEDHLATFLLDVIDELDLGAIEAVIQLRDPRGERPYSPRMLVTLLLYGYCSGIFSSRRLARATWTDLGARVIAAESHPHFTTINQFRLDHLDAVEDLFTQVLRLCQRAGLVDLGHVAVDGTKIQANASKHKAMSYDRMQETEARLRREVESLLERAKATDEAEDKAFGADQEGPSIPEELKRRETRRESLAKARRAMEAEAAAVRADELLEQAKQARENAEQAPDDRTRRNLKRRGDRREFAAKQLGGSNPDAVPGAQDGLPFHRMPHERDGKPTPKAQRNFTDPESRIMKSGTSFQQGYNSQIAVDEKAQIIVAQLVTNQSPDGEHLVPILEKVREVMDTMPRTCTADAGYWSETNAQFCQDNGIDAYISTRRRRHAEADDAERPDAELQASARTELAKQMHAKVTSPAGRIVYAKRKWTVEPVFGEVKEARGFRRFRLRGLRKVRAEFSLVGMGHNLLKLWKSGRKRAE